MSRLVTAAALTFALGGCREIQTQGNTEPAPSVEPAEPAPQNTGMTCEGRCKGQGILCRRRIPANHMDAQQCAQIVAACVKACASAPAPSGS